MSRVLLVVLASLQLAALSTIHDAAYAREDSRGAAARISRQDPGDAPVVLLGQGAAPVARYLGDRPVLYLYPRHLADRSRLREATDPLLATTEEAWLVESRPWTVDPDGDVEALLRETFVVGGEFDFTGGRARRLTRKPAMR